MKILIEIADSDYADIMSDSERNLNHYERLIKKGVPLPKGHGNLIFREDAEAIFKNARKTLYAQSRKEQIEDFQIRENILLNAEQIVHLIEPIIEADKAESEG